MHILGDSLVLVDEQPGLLCFGDLLPGSVQVRSRYEEAMEGCESYTEGKDYLVDYQQGTLRRTASSRIPNFRTNILFGVKGFDHTKYPQYGNHEYFIWVDYEAPVASALADAHSQAYLLPRTVQRLQAGGPFKVIAYGDSITAGGEAAEVRLRYQERWVTELGKLYPKAELLSENGATGGDASFQGIERLEEKVLTRSPDLVLIAFGMNDLRTPRAVFIKNLIEMISQIRSRTPAEVMLISTFPPNPDWIYASGNSDEIAEATEAAAHEAHCAYADVHSVWTRVLLRKDLPSLLGNNINHPNNFGHWLYLQALLAAFPG
ncbi:MAG: SGNH/GDSL hydrolase family protein [Chloroflexi bacterium]|nr:SGNH/GDSL hydrolase family protein [Chloroflexota bacterium]